MTNARFALIGAALSFVISIVGAGVVYGSFKEYVDQHAQWMNVRAQQVNFIGDIETMINNQERIIELLEEDKE